MGATAAVFPCTSERSVAREAGGGQVNHTDGRRWRVGPSSSAEGDRAACCAVADFEEVVSDAAACGGLKLILYEKEPGTRLTDFLKQAEGERPERVVIACGPEGGFTENEVGRQQSQMVLSR